MKSKFGKLILTYILGILNWFYFHWTPTSIPSSKFWKSNVFTSCPKLKISNFATVGSTQIFLKRRDFPSKIFIVKIVSTYNWLILKHVGNSGLKCPQHQGWFIKVCNTLKLLWWQWRANSLEWWHKCGKMNSDECLLGTSCVSHWLIGFLYRFL